MAMPKELGTEPAQKTAQLVVREELLDLPAAELDRLLDALAQLDLRGAEAVGEQITALRLAGGVIVLTPTEAELAALEGALAALAEEPERLGPALLRLAGLCADHDPGEVLRREPLGDD